MRWSMVAGATILSLGALVGTGTTAEARDGCGPGFHRNWRGWCRPNFGPRVFYAPVVGYRTVVVGPRWGYRPWGYGYRHVGWHRGGWGRPWGYGGGWHRVGWGGWGHHHGWHHRW
ncbi:GCG_CRPN prefix-to-repeats domain-containing protein [Methylobacterium terricola]